jgi:dehydrogenase/reductase SDR family member 7B
MDVKNKIIWLTGASSGIGEGLAIALAKQGAKLILSARQEGKLIQLKQQLTNSDLHRVVPLDLADSTNFNSRLSVIISEMGNIDILINNAGISLRSTARETQLAVHRQVMEVNYFGTIAMTQTILPNMLSAGSGMIVTIASVAGKVAGKGMSGYSGSKHAIIGYMDSLRAEESENGIQVLTICPGFVQTNISINSMTGDGKTLGTMSKAIRTGITVTDCADKIILAIKNNKDEVVIGKGISYWAPIIKRFTPNLLRKLVAKNNYRD